MRPGHHRPLGTTTWMRMQWDAERQPELGDIACHETALGADDADVVRRAYRIIGIEEGAPGRYRLLAERVEYGTLPESLEPDAIWAFYNLPR